MYNYPELFTAYLAGSPWFQTNDQYWLKNIDRMAQHKNFPQKFLFMTVGKDESELTINTYKNLEQWMNSQNLDGLHWKSAWLEGDHSSMVGRNIYDGLLFFFNGWKPSTAMLHNAEIDQLKTFMKSSEEKWGQFGFDWQSILPEQRLNALGYGLINRGELEKALEIFKYNLELYPESFNAHDSLAECFLTMGDKENAIKYYKLAVELNSGTSDYAKRILQNSKDKLKELGVK